LHLLHHMQRSGVAPDVATYTTLLNLCAATAPQCAAFLASARLICGHTSLRFPPCSSFVSLFLYRARTSLLTS
jgi:hypothetical protein